ncbi:MAG TPA: tripartite tricarboxylate transporter TctB family protein [Euzebyales bacterium]|nr:tripartite tricarboxylate transporter TctB family protein [Euzebyales bacterium]
MPVRGEDGDQVGRRDAGHGDGGDQVTRDNGAPPSGGDQVTRDDGAPPPGGDPAAVRDDVSGPFSRAHQEVAVAALLLVTLVFLRVRLDSLITGRRGRTFIEPDFWPATLLTFGIVLSIIYLVLAVMRVRQVSADPQVEPAPRRDVPPDRHNLAAKDLATGSLGGLAGGFALLAGYIYLMTPIGFVPSTVLFCIVFLLFVGERRWYAIAGFTVIAVVALLGVFTRLLVVPLPRGTGVFLQFSTYLY